jgi:hypothetical protein
VKMRESACGIAVLSLVAAGLAVAAQPAHAVAATRAGEAVACSPVLKAVSVSPASVPGGARSTVTATVSCAPPKAVTIGLAGFAGIHIPPALHLAAGKTSVSGTITTATTRTARHGSVIALLGKVRKGSTFHVGITPKTCKSPVLSAATLPSLAYVGDRPVLAVKLSCTPAAAVRLTLKSSNASLPVPATVTVGAYYSAASVALTPKAYKPGQYKSTVSAHYGRKTLTRAITVDPGLSVFANSGVSCSPNSVNPYIYFSGYIPVGGLTVKLKSDNAAITVPATATFPYQPGILGGQISGVTTVKPVSTDTKVTLSAILGSRTLTQSVVLLRPWRSSDGFTFQSSPAPGSYYGPSYGYGYSIDLSHPADPSGNGLTGTVTTDHPGDVKDLGSQVDVTSGCDSGSISFDVPYETTPVHATITVSLGSTTAVAALTIEPSLATVTIPATITGGQPAMGTVTLAGAPDAADTVYLNSSWGILTVPDSVTIPAGQTSATFPITTATVTSDSQVAVGAFHLFGSQVADSVTSNTTDVTP